MHHYQISDIFLRLLPKNLIQLLYLTLMLILDQFCPRVIEKVLNYLIPLLAQLRASLKVFFEELPIKLHFLWASFINGLHVVIVFLILNHIQRRS